MIWQLAKKDFLNNVFSARFVIGFVLCLVLIPFTILINIDDYREKDRLFQMDRDAAEKIMKQVRVYSGLRPEIVLPPEPLSVFSKGISGQVGNRVNVWLGEKPLLAEGRAAVRDNPFLDAFSSVDFVDIAAIIFSLLALLFSYDAITKEKESGTLGLQMSNSVGRSQLLAGKVLGILMTLLPVMLFSFLLGALIVLFSPGVSFGGLEWTRIAFVFAASLVYLSVFVFAGLFTSARSRTSVTSLVVCLFIWVFFVLGIPHVAVYAAESSVRVGSHDNLTLVLADLNKSRDEQIEARRQSLPSPDWDMNWYMNGGQDGDQEMYGNTRSLFEQDRQLAMFSEPLRIEYADRKWTSQKAYLGSLGRQARSAERISMVSPAGVFRRVASALCTTDRRAHEADLDRSRECREAFVRYLQGKDIFSSFRWITPAPPEPFRTADELIRLRTGGRFNTLAEYEAWASGQKDFWARFEVLRKVEIPGEKPDDYPYLDISDMPRFPPRLRSLRMGLEGSVVGVGLLLVEAIFLFYLGFVAFIRYDVR